MILSSDGYSKDNRSYRARNEDIDGHEISSPENQEFHYRESHSVFNSKLVPSVQRHPTCLGEALEECTECEAINQ